VFVVYAEIYMGINASRSENELALLIALIGLVLALMGGRLMYLLSGQTNTSSTNRA
jgi:hypothetical protein